MFSKFFFVFGIAGTLVLAGCNHTTDTPSHSTDMTAEVSETSQQVEEMEKKMAEKTEKQMTATPPVPPAPVEKEIMELKETPTPVVASATYTDYNSDDFSAHSGKKVVFFHAEWCGTCRNWEANIKNELGSLPANTYIAKVDYDTNTEMKQKYGVAVQSTAVFIDEKGVVVKKEGDPSMAMVREFFER